MVVDAGVVSPRCNLSGARNTPDPLASMHHVPRAICCSSLRSQQLSLGYLVEQSCSFFFLVRSISGGLVLLKRSSFPFITTPEAMSSRLKLSTVVLCKLKVLRWRCRLSDWCDDLKINSNNFSWRVLFTEPISSITS